MKKQKPAAFMSYVHSDDKYGRLTELHERLSDEVRVQIGEEFPIFQDHKDILWGQNWKERIEKSLNEVTFLIPIITPSFFSSRNCRDELQQFLEREKILKRNDLILPVYYVDCPLLNEKAKRATNKLAQVIATRQCADWRDLRFEPFTSPQVGKALAQLAAQIRDALERGRAPSKEVVPESAARASRRRAQEIPVTLPQGAESVTDSSKSTREPLAKKEPPTRVVDPMYRGDYTTITEAIDAANPGDRILVLPGLYQEGLVIDKALEIIGEGDPDEIVIQATGKEALSFRATMGRVANLTLRQMGGGEWYCVDIAQGRLELEGCDITSQSLSCVAIHGTADPRLRRNRIHDSKESGVYIYENGQGTLEDNDIFGSGLSQVAIKKGGNPMLRRNRINKNGYHAVWVYSGGGGTIEDNDLRDNRRGAWDVSPDSKPKLKQARNQE